VNKCQSYLYIGHSETDVIMWERPDPDCSVVGAVTCFPNRNTRVPEATPGSIWDNDWGSTPENLPTKWPNIPMHNNKLVMPSKYPDSTIGDQVINGRNRNQEGDWTKPESMEHDYDKAVLNALSNASHREIVDRLCYCDCACTEIEFIVYIQESDETEFLLHGWQANTPSFPGLKMGNNHWRMSCP
jgi:hypothetical protein